MLMLMFVIGNPFQSFLYELGCFQLYVVLFTTVLAIPWLCASQLVYILANPYVSDQDRFNIDAVIKET